MEKLLLDELKGSINYFLIERSLLDGGYGLVKDRYPNLYGYLSISATGFGLSAYALAVEYGILARDDAETEVLKTIRTLKSIKRDHGFYYHFYQEDGTVFPRSELSDIDSSLLYFGLIYVSEYFKGKVKEESDSIIADVDWRYFADPKTKWFYMGERDGGFYAHWSTYSEQLPIYVLAASAPNPEYRVGKEYYDHMEKLRGSYHGIDFLYSWCGSLFTHQFAMGYLDLKGMKDEEGTDYFHNSVLASMASRQYSIDNPSGYKGYGPDSWGRSASDGPDGYEGDYGTPPSGENSTIHKDDGTIACYASLGSIIFTPEESIACLKRMVNIPGLSGKYGLKDSYNETKGWVAECTIAIDKGIGMLMIANYDQEAVHRYFMDSALIKEGLNLLGIKKEG